MLTCPVVQVLGNISLIGTMLAVLFRNETIRKYMHRLNLTARETDVLHWVAEGKSSWEIGMILSISERTVKFHLSNIYRKFGVTSRAQAIVHAIKMNLLQSEAG